MTTAQADTSLFADLDLQASAILAVLTHLQAAPPTSENLAAWLKEYSTAKKKSQTLWVQLYVATKRDTNNPEIQARYRYMIEAWVPKLEAYDVPLTQIAMQAGIADLMPRIGAYLQESESTELPQADALRDALTRERQLAGEYDTLTANQTILVNGNQLLLQDAEARLEREQDPEERQMLWDTITTSERAMAISLDALFSALLEARQQIAAAAGSAHYAEYIWNTTHREYSIEDAVTLMDGIAGIFAQVAERTDQDRAVRLGVGRLRPWNLTVQPALPSTTVLTESEYLAMAQELLEGLDPAFGRVLRHLLDRRQLDLLPRLGKAGGNFAAHHLATGTTDVVCNLNGSLEHLRALLHELGHAIHWHTRSANPETTYWDFVEGQEVSEFCAFVFTFLGSRQLLKQGRANTPEGQWFQRSMVESILLRLQEVDERVRMELWLYQQTQKIPTSEIDTYFLTLYHRSAVDWTDHQATLKKGWQKRHLFLYSFYNVEYAIATIAALLFVQAYDLNPQQATDRLKRAMRLGATAGPRMIFAEAGIDFPFTPEQLRMARDVLTEWLN